MIWLVGNRGMLGTEIESLMASGARQYLASDREVDISRPGAPAEYLRAQGVRHLEWIINCAAYTAVEQAEEEPGIAFAVNETGAWNLAETARSFGAALLHISTDYVFDGNKEGSYLEEDAPNPIGVYGRSKLQGELAIARVLERFLILRTAWLYGANGNNFVRTMLRLFRERERVAVVADQWGSPTYAKDLATAIIAILASGRSSWGIYHFTNEGRTSWYEFAREILRQAVARGLAKADVEIAPIHSCDYPAKVKRPQNSFLSKDKIVQTFGIAVPGWREALSRYFDEGVY